MVGPASMTDEGWQQLEAGVALMRWSRLVHWNQIGLALSAADESEFESGGGHSTVHAE